MNELTLNQKFVYYLMSCYLYYIEDAHVLNDIQFDDLCKELLEHWDEITHHHKYLISKDDLEAGTGYAIQYPSSVVGAARHWYRSQIPPTPTK